MSNLPMRSCVVFLFVMAHAATADPIDVGAPGPGGERLVAGERLFRPPVEWSTWLRGAGVAWVGDGSDGRTARVVLTPTEHSRVEVGAGIEASLPLSIHGNARVGAWAELRGLERGDAFAGAELVFTAVPPVLDLFLYEGSGVLALRAGRSATHETAAVAFGYLAPWKLEGPCAVRFFSVATGVCAPRPARATRYMVGVRLVATATRARSDRRDWTLSAGVEFELAGALRTLGFRSWY
ncbi:MAG: hypothetical protein R3B06_04390 [Kofleriaceae bacterium]